MSLPIFGNTGDCDCGCEIANSYTGLTVAGISNSCYTFIITISGTNTYCRKCLPNGEPDPNYTLGNAGDCPLNSDGSTNTYWSGSLDAANYGPSFQCAGATFSLPDGAYDFDTPYPCGVVDSGDSSYYCPCASPCPWIGCDSGACPDTPGPGSGSGTYTSTISCAGGIISVSLNAFTLSEGGGSYGMTVFSWSGDCNGLPVGGILPNQTANGGYGMLY